MAHFDARKLMAGRLVQEYLWCKLVGTTNQVNLPVCQPCLPPVPVSLLPQHRHPLTFLVFVLLAAVVLAQLFLAAQGFAQTPSESSKKEATKCPTCVSPLLLKKMSDQLLRISSQNITIQKALARSNKHIKAMLRVLENNLAHNPAQLAPPLPKEKNADPSPSPEEVAHSVSTSTSNVNSPSPQSKETELTIQQEQIQEASITASRLAQGTEGHTFLKFKSIAQETLPTLPTEDEVATQAFRKAMKPLQNAEYALMRKNLLAFIKIHKLSKLVYPACYWIAQTYFRAEDFAIAMKYYKCAIKKNNPKRDISLLRIADIHIEARDYAASSKVLQQLKNESKDPVIQKIVLQRLHIIEQKQR